MTRREIETHQDIRRGNYGYIVEDFEVISESIPEHSKHWWKYSENYILEIK